MIPYEELVIALQSWRAKQGLPISQMSAQIAPPVQETAPAPVPRSNPPAPPPRSNPPAPPPLDEAVDVDDAAMLEEAAYDNEGNDFAMAFGQKTDDQDADEATAIGGEPRPVDAATDPHGLPTNVRSNNRNDDW